MRKPGQKHKGWKAAARAKFRDQVEKELNEGWTRVFGGDSARAAAFRDLFREAVKEVQDRQEQRPPVHSPPRMRHSAAGPKREEGT